MYIQFEEKDYRNVAKKIKEAHSSFDTCVEYHGIGIEFGIEHEGYREYDTNAFIDTHFRFELGRIDLWDDAIDVDIDEQTLDVYVREEFNIRYC